MTIGDELLIGQVVDTNAAWMAAELNLAGVKVIRKVSVPDDIDQIVSALDEAGKRAEVILVTGGLGPTRDDRTKQALCGFFGTDLRFDEETFENVKKIFDKRGLPVIDANRKQAEVPSGCTVLNNSLGTAPGMRFEKDGKLFFSMPGVPYEMKAIMKEYVLPELKNKNRSGNIMHKTILTTGIGESFLSEKISAWENVLPGGFSLAYLPSPGFVKLRISAYGTDESLMKKEMDKQVQHLLSMAGDYIFGYDDDTLEGVTGRMLLEKNKTISTAESCTGGAIARMITSVAGSSAYFRGGVVSYSNASKQKILGVPEEMLEACGAVSEDVVRAMAEGSKNLFETDFAVACSGVAGPAGGTAEKPVGTVWIALACAGRTIARRFIFGEKREYNIRMTAVTALDMLRKELGQR